jgi:flagellar assembly factor FliW
VEVSDSEAERIGITDPAAADVYVTVRAGETIEDFRANLRAPILVSGGRGHQVINEASDTSVRAPLFSEVAAVEQVA